MIRLGLRNPRKKERKNNSEEPDPPFSGSSILTLRSGGRLVCIWTYIAFAVPFMAYIHSRGGGYIE